MLKDVLFGIGIMYSHQKITLYTYIIKAVI